MIQWIKDSIICWHQARQNKKRMWEVWINGKIWLRVPSNVVQQMQWGTWGKMQAKILSSFQQHWQDVHTYIRFHTYLPDHFSDILKPDQYEVVATAKGEDHIFLFPDCQDEHLWATLLESAGLVPCARSIFILNYKPLNWQKVITNLLDITQSLSDGHSLDEFENELSICHCLCYSMDEDLVVAKVDLPKSTILSILEETAQEEDLNLVLHRQT